LLSVINMAAWITSLALASHTLRIAIGKWRDQGGYAALKRQGGASAAVSSAAV
jgi:hypothetical protein